MIILEVIGCWLAAYMVCGAVHEGAHVVSGLCQGWKFMLLVVGPFKLYRDENDKVKFGIEKNILLWGGIGGTLPREEGGNYMQVFANTLIAGPTASVVFGLVAGVVMVFHFSIFSAMMCAVPLAMGVSCLLPGVKSGILFNDGTRYSRIAKGGRTAAEEEAVFRCVLKEMFRPAGRFDEQSINVMTGAEDTAFRYMGHYYACCNAMKDGDEARKAQELAAMESLKGSVSKGVISMCAIEEQQ